MIVVCMLEIPHGVESRAQRVQKIKIFDKRNIVESSVDKKEGLITANFGT